MANTLHYGTTSTTRNLHTFKYYNNIDYSIKLIQLLTTLVNFSIAVSDSIVLTVVSTFYGLDTNFEP